MRKFLKYLSIIFLIFVLAKNCISQSLNEDKKKILMLEDLRSSLELSEFQFNTPDSGGVFLGDLFERLKSDQFYALANCGDTAVIAKTGFVHIPKSYWNKAYYFMLGQNPSYFSKENLISCLNQHSKYIDESFDKGLDYDVSLKNELLNSLGKIGDEINLDELFQNYAKYNPHDSISLRGFAMAFARFALRKIKDEKSIEILNYIADNTTDTPALRNTAFAYWRIGDKGMLQNAKQEIYTLAMSKDPQTRMWAFNAMGKLKDEVLLLDILENFDSETDWRVKVNMLNSITNFDMDSLEHLHEKILDVLGSYKQDESEHVSLTRLNVLGKLFAGKKTFSGSDDVKKGLIEIINSDKYSWRIRSEAANTLSLIYKDEVKNNLFKAFANATDYDLKSGILKAFGNFDDGMVYKEVRDTITTEVKKYNDRNPNVSGELIASTDLAKLYRGFVDMLSNLYKKIDEENQNTVRLIFTEFAGSKDPLIVDVSLSALKDSLYLKYRDETNQVLLFDYSQLEFPKDYDVNLVLIDAMKDLNNDKTVKVLEDNLKSENYEIAKSSADALEKITGNKYTFGAKPRTDFDWNYIESLSQKKFITVKTNKGDIKIELLPDVAPFTVMNFLKLAGKNFYNGTIFHRVVSNFVIQGGDPSGTGYGSPGYTIRSEFSPLTYERGMVGMASSGKDTEGSQFFITHSATPHLDGKYTIFGKVLEGMDVVDKIMIGDYIEGIKIIPK